MKFYKNDAKLFIPDNVIEIEALLRTTDLCIAAHPDDIEIMAYGPIIECYDRADRWFTGVVLTGGSGSPRSGIYADYTNEDMTQIREKEQISAAITGKYSAQFLLSYKSSEIKSPYNLSLLNELKEIIISCSPEIIYTHNLADKHDTHVAVVLNVIKAIRELPKQNRPNKLISMEVWRSLDWLCDEDKVLFDTSPNPDIASALLRAFQSQITGGKRYDLASISRRIANATFTDSYNIDKTNSVSFGLDITGLVENDMEPAEFISNYIDKFKDEVNKRVSLFYKGL